MKYIGLILSIILLLSYNENIMSQNIIKPKYSDAYEVEQIISMKGDYVVFKRAGTEFDLNKKEIQYVIHEELGLIFGSVEKQVTNLKSNYNIDTLDINNYKGFLLAEGNKVFIPQNSPNDYERAGATSLKDIIKEKLFWIAVDSEYEAHFILEYIVDTSGSDNAYYKILSRDRSFVFNSKKDGYNVPGINRLGYKSTNENIDKNIEVAKKLHKECIEPLYDIIKKYTRKNKVPRYLKDFDIRH